MINRRKLLKALGTSSALSFLPGISKAQAPYRPANSFKYCLNMATIRGHNLGFVEELEVASKAGFKAVEIWMDSLQTYLDKGGTLKETKNLLVSCQVEVVG